MIRVLHVIGAMNRAGAETFLMNLYRSIDRKKVQFDFLVHAQGTCDYDEEIERLGGRLFHVPRYTILNAKRYTNAVRNILKEHPENTIVHSHIGSSAPAHLKIAREEGRFTIAHSHAQTKMDSLENILFHFVSKPVRGRADRYMACSLEAAEDRFGKTIAHSEDCIIIQNGIQVDDYKRNADLVTAAKEDLKVQGHPVFGHVGRFVHDKNHIFLLDVFKGINVKLPDALLLLSGKGNLESMVRKAAKERGLEDKVIFLGLRSDIPHVLHAMDVFLFPSHHEGLGIALVEAQAAGLECIASTGVPEAAMCTDRAQRISLDSVETWTQSALAAYQKASSRSDDNVQKVREAGFDMATIANQLEAFYEECDQSAKINSTGA